VLAYLYISYLYIRVYTAYILELPKVVAFFAYLFIFA